MKDTALTGVLRKEDFGSAGSRRVLASGRIPAVIYGKADIDPVHITLDARDFQNKMRHISESTILTIKVGRKNHMVLMREVQENILKGIVLHVDFYEVTKGETLKARVPIVVVGNPEGAKFGGVLEHVTYDVEVESLPQDLPQHIEVDVTHLGLNDSIKVEELVIPEGVKILTLGDSTVVTVKSIKEVVAEVEEGDETAEEVVAEGSSEESDE